MPKCLSLTGSVAACREFADLIEFALDLEPDVSIDGASCRLKYWQPSPRHQEVIAKLRSTEGFEGRLSLSHSSF